MAVETVTGGTIDGVVITGIVIEDVESPLFVRLGDQPSGERSPPPGQLRNVVFRDITAIRAGTTPSSITGLTGHPVEMITLERVRIVSTGGGRAPGGPVPEVAADYPRVDMFGDLPASGLYVRHAKVVRLRDVRLETLDADDRPTVVTDDADVLETDLPRPRA